MISPPLIPRHVIVENYPSSQSLRFLCALVANSAEFSGLLFGFYGIFNFLVGWASFGSCLNQHSCGIKADKADETDGFVRTLLIILTIFAVVTEIGTCLLITKVLTKVYYQWVQTRFNLQPTNILLRRTSVFVAGVCLFLTLQLFCYLNLTFQAQRLHSDSIESTYVVPRNRTRPHDSAEYFDSVEEVEVFPGGRKNNAWGIKIIDDAEGDSASSSVENDQYEGNDYSYEEEYSDSESLEI